MVGIGLNRGDRKSAPEHKIRGEGHLILRRSEVARTLSWASKFSPRGLCILDRSYDVSEV